MAARDHLRAWMRDHGLKATRQREDILRAFLGADRHVGVEEILRLVRLQNPRIGHATVYRTMRLLVDCGLAEEHHFGDGVTLFEPARGDGRGHHDHLICLDCGTIVEFEEPVIEQLQDQVAHKHGFALSHHRMELYGLCADCRKASDPRAG
jgi:Fur family transcriptional regulator, ferric uptake regulator